MLFWLTVDMAYLYFSFHQIFQCSNRKKYNPSLDFYSGPYSFHLQTLKFWAMFCTLLENVLLKMIFNQFDLFLKQLNKHFETKRGSIVVSLLIQLC